MKNSFIRKFIEISKIVNLIKNHEVNKNYN